MPEHGASGPSHRSSSIRSQSPLNIADAESSNWWQEANENNIHGQRTESPGPILHSAIPSRLRYPASLTTPAHYQNVESHGPHHPCSTAPSERPLSVVQEASQSICIAALQGQIKNLPSPVQYRESTDNEVIEIASGKPEIDGEVADSGSGLEDNSDDDIDSDDNSWSGSNDSVEAAIFQAAFPDYALAAHLITRMYATLALGSSKMISRKVSSWQERITICANNSGTASTQTTTTQKAAAPISSPSTPSVASSKRDRLSGSADSNMGEEEDEEDDDNDESRCKRLKANSLGDGPIIQLACPFYKMDPAKYDFQNNKGSKQSRACRGPGYRTIQLLKEHLKRAHYPVQCDRCHLIFRVKGADRTSAVKNLEEHRQLDEPCLKKPPSMREGISDAQWSSLNEGKQSRKGNAIATETPKSNLEKWMDIWAILFPGKHPPKTPWYDTTPSDMTTSYQFQGVHHFLEVFATAIENKLPDIKATALSKTDEELKNMLLDISKIGFQVWSTTVRWSDTSTSSLSNSRRSEPFSSTSWTQISKQVSASQQKSPNMHSASVFPEAKLANQTHRSGIIHSSTGHRGINENPENVLRSNPYPQQDVSTSPHGTVPSTAVFDLAAGYEASGFPGFPGNQYSTDLEGMPNTEWVTSMDPLQFDPNFDMTGTQSQSISGGPPSQWGDHQYSPQSFGRYSGRP